QSTSRTTLPLPGSLPKEPIISTPTYTSPDGATANVAGLGTRSGPANPVISKSFGQFRLGARESIKASDSLLSCGRQVSVFLRHPIAKASNRRTRLVLSIIFKFYEKRSKVNQSLRQCRT